MLSTAKFLAYHSLMEQTMTNKSTLCRAGLATAMMLVAATTAQAANNMNRYNNDGSMKSMMFDPNCMFKSAVIQKGGETTRTNNWEGSNVKDQWCSPTARNDATYNNSSNYYQRQNMRNNARTNSNMAPATGY